LYCTVDRVVLCLNEESLPHPMEMTELAREHIAVTRAGYGGIFRASSAVLHPIVMPLMLSPAYPGETSSTCCTPVGGGGPSWRPLLLAAADGFVAAQQHEQ